ncbi:transaldolase [Micromonospora sp. LAH09]|uniref:transaldolase family protein n=1 Tax=Micromonospora cabrerizensis TaxID=2911213 RepID=UPI001EE8AA4B|nr:transaldolase family protein [Micromonospora cabrerizensis]MCG5468332.1 transaldolase [Micromonospora cabrerizensis]
MTENLRQLAEAGVTIWRDDPATAGPGHPLVSGLAIGVAALLAELTGPQGGAGLAGADGDVDDAVRGAAAGVAQRAADALRPRYDASGGRDGLVSLEIDPRLADDPDGTVAEARRITELVDRPNLLLAVPATAAAPTAVTALLAEGIGVNVTQVYAPAQVRSVLDAVREGLTAAEGFPPAIVSVPVADVDTEVDKRLWAIGTDGSARLRGTAALAGARMAFAAFENALRVRGWTDLTALGSPRPRLAWTSTQVRDPYYLETRYVDELVAPGVLTVLTAATFAAVVEQSEVRGDTVHGSYEDAHGAVERLTSIGIDHDDVHRVLREKANARATTAWLRLRDTVAAAQRQPVG